MMKLLKFFYTKTGCGKETSTILHIYPHFKHENVHACLEHNIHNLCKQLNRQASHKTMFNTYISAVILVLFLSLHCSYTTMEMSFAMLCIN